LFLAPEGPLLGIDVEQIAWRSKTVGSSEMLHAGGKTMRRLMTLLAATSLAICAAPFGRAESFDLPKPDALQVAKNAELKGDLERIHNNYILAVSYYKQALRADSKNPQLYNKLGISELKLGDRGAARKDFKQALKRDPRNISALNNLGAVAYLDKKYKDSVKYLKQALELDESSAAAHLNLAEAWMGMGQLDRAMTE
jgi:tetratricopeptide (TPR) repeat protein